MLALCLLPRDVFSQEPTDTTFQQPEKSARKGLDIKVTPVDIDREKPEQPVLHYYDKHGNPLDTPVRFLAELDTVKKVRSGPKYPLYSGVSVGVNFFDALMMIFGQKRANFDIGVSCSLWNWLFPTVEVGLGYSNSRPDDGRTYFKVKPSMYVKAGFNYNFLYKGNPDYRLFAGMRFCYSGFSYDIPVIRAGSQYYTSPEITSMYGLTARCWYAEILAGLEVKIYKGIMMGWNVRMDFNLKNKYSDPAYPAWFIPGRNASTAIGATYYVGYRF